MFRRHQRLAADEESHGVGVQRQAMRPRLGESLGHVGNLEKAVMEAQGIKALAEFLDLDALRGRHERRIVHHHLSRDDALVQDLVVLQIVQQRTGNHIAARAQEHGGARDAPGVFVGAVQEQL